MVCFRTFSVSGESGVSSRRHGDTFNPVGMPCHWSFCCLTRSPLLMGAPGPTAEAKVGIFPVPPPAAFLGFPGSR